MWCSSCETEGKDESGVRMTHDVQAYLEDNYDEGVEQARPSWAVTSEAEADWAIDKVLRARESLVRIKANAAARVAAAEREVERAEAFFKPLLEEWAKDNPPRKGKTIKLLSGDLGFKTKPAGYAFADEAATLLWAQTELPEAVKLKPSLLRTNVTAYIQATGEVPPGVERTPEQETFFIK